MLAYAAHSRPTGRTGSAKALALIIVGHAVLIAAVMTAKMEFVVGTPFDPTDIINIPVDPPNPPPPEPKAEAKPIEATQPSFIDDPAPMVDMDVPLSASTFNQGATIDDIGKVIGTELRIPAIDPPTPAPVRLAAKLSTSGNALKPPYPLDMRRAEQEATLKLKLTIDARGRVTAVEPVGVANPSFLEAARRHIIRTWRYKPATEDGIAVASSTVITLSFRLEDV
jgi:protein TonB